MTDLSLYITMAEKTFIQIKRDNEKAIGFNKLIGYKLVPGEEEKVLQKYVLFKSDYDIKAVHIRKWLEIASGSTEGTIHLPSVNSDVGLYIYNLYTTEETEIRHHFKLSVKNDE